MGFSFFLFVFLLRNSDVNNHPLRELEISLRSVSIRGVKQHLPYFCA